MTVSAETSYLINALVACRKAKITGRGRDLREAHAMLDQPEFSALPERAQVEVKDAYAAAASVVMGVDW